MRRSKGTAKREAGTESCESPGMTWEGEGHVGLAGQPPAMMTGQLHLPSVHVHWVLVSDVLPQKSTSTVPWQVWPSSLQAVSGVPTTACEGQPFGPSSPPPPQSNPPSTPDPDAHRADVLDWGFTETLRAFDEHPAPVIASIQGVCVGGGFELALACDLIIAAESAKIGSVEVTVGLHPLMGGVQRLTQRAGAARAKEMALLGRRYPAAALERWNIINWVVADEQLEQATMVLAQELAHGPSIAHAATKRLVSVAVNDGIAAADEAMAEIARPIIGSADFRTGVRSYRERGIGMAEFEGK